VSEHLRSYECNEKFVDAVVEKVEAVIISLCVLAPQSAVIHWHAIATKEYLICHEALSDLTFAQ